MQFRDIGTSRRPRKVTEIHYAAGPGGSLAGYKTIYMMGELLSGTMSDGDIEPITDADDAATKFGVGSFGAFYIAQVFRGGKLKCRIVGVGVDEPSGDAAEQTFTFVGVASSNGVITVNVCGAVFSFAIENSDSVTAIGDKMVAAFVLLSIDVKPPCTLANAVGTVTATMNNKGAIANSAPTYQIITGNEPGTTALTVGGCCFGVGAATPGTLYPTLTTALANLTTVVTPCLVHPWDETPDGSTKPADLIRAHMELKCAAEVGHRGNVIGSSTKASATLVTDRGLLDDDDGERYRMVGQAITIATNSPGTWHPANGAYAANAWGQIIDVAHPFDNVALPYMVAPPDASDILNNDGMDVLIEAGITVLNYNADRQRTLLIKGIGTRLFSGAPQPWAIVDSVDYVRYLHLQNLEAALPAGTKLAENGEDNLDENCTTPEGVLDVYHATLYSAQLKGIVRNRDEAWAACIAEINTTDADRVDESVDVAIMAGLSVIATKLRQRAGILTEE